MSRKREQITYKDMKPGFELPLEILKCSKATKLSCHFEVINYEKKIHQNMRIYIPVTQTH